MLALFQRDNPMFPIPGFVEPFSSISHMAGIAAMLVYAWPVLKRAHGRPGRVVSISIFILAALLVLSFSTIYHLLPLKGTTRAVFQILDHAAIFVLIAGTFTPIHAILFRGFWRWGIITIQWGLAAIGVTLKLLFFASIPEPVSLLSFLAMGWIGLFSGIKLARMRGVAFVMPVIYGALAYTFGAIIDFARIPTLLIGVVEAHELFHLAVLAGLAFHGYFIWKIADE